jgi:hypothetical protein
MLACKGLMYIGRFKKMYAGRNGLDCGVKILYLPEYMMTLHIIIKYSFSGKMCIHISQLVLTVTVCMFNILECIIIS